MSVVLIARALEKHLGTLTPAVAIAGENGTYTPVTGTPYQATTLLPASTLTRDVAERVHEERGIFQVMVCYPSAQGPVNARTRAEAIRQHYTAGLRLTEGGQDVEILGKPSIAPALTPTGWYCIPVRINYKAIVQTA
ncbi:MAG TPA: DUF4128 domain-containing protein [Limnobacter sp.]|nr:DUF4128 domain-containing protein [Limnobacter sp.]